LDGKLKQPEGNLPETGVRGIHYFLPHTHVLLLQNDWLPAGHSAPCAFVAFCFGEPFTPCSQDKRRLDAHPQIVRRFTWRRTEVRIPGFADAAIIVPLAGLVPPCWKCRDAQGMFAGSPVNINRSDNRSK